MESENNRNEEILQETQEGGQTIFLPTGILNGDLTSIKRVGAQLAPDMKLNDVYNTVNRINSLFLNRMGTTAKILVPAAKSLDSGKTYIDRPLFLSDLLDLVNPNSDISKVFEVLPIAQFKHLPDPSVLKDPSPIIGGQYNLSTNPLNELRPETSEVSSEETLEETPEVMPSLEVEEPVTSGGARSHKWSSHKKRRHTRIRTKKNKKL